jgi:hypothetical protein
MYATAESWGGVQTIPKHEPWRRSRPLDMFGGSSCEYASSRLCLGATKTPVGPASQSDPEVKLAASAASHVGQVPGAQSPWQVVCSCNLTRPQIVASTFGITRAQPSSSGIRMRACACETQKGLEEHIVLYESRPNNNLRPQRVLPCDCGEHILIQCQ